MLEKLFGGDPLLSRVQDNVDKALRSLKGDIDGVATYSPQYFDVTMTGSTATITHDLGRIPTGWYLVDLDAQITIYRTAWDTTTLTLSKGAAIGTPNLKVAVF